jgi:uncharacterized membrane protein YjfL (UPF0719 family)
MVLAGLVGVVMIAVPGLPVCAVHDPVPAAAIVALPPGNIAHVIVWSGPALGFAVTTTDAVSEHPPFVQIKLYVPATLNVVMVVVALVEFVIVAVPGFPACAVHVPVPVAAIVAKPPGRIAQLTS